MDIKKYSIAVYSDALLEEDEPSENDDCSVSSIFDNISFYEKRFHVAYIKESTHDKYSPEDLVLLSKENKTDETPSSHIILDEDEWIENISESMVVCNDPETYEEVDGIKYLEEKGLFYFLAETGPMLYSIWCDE